MSLHNNYIITYNLFKNFDEKLLKYIFKYLFTMIENNKILLLIYINISFGKCDKHWCLRGK